MWALEASCRCNDEQRLEQKTAEAAALHIHKMRNKIQWWTMWAFNLPAFCFNHALLKRKKMQFTFLLCAWLAFTGLLPWTPKEEMEYAETRIKSISKPAWACLQHISLRKRAAHCALHARFAKNHDRRIHILKHAMQTRRHQQIKQSRSVASRRVCCSRLSSTKHCTYVKQTRENDIRHLPSGTQNECMHRKTLTTCIHIFM